MAINNSSNQPAVLINISEKLDIVISLLANNIDSVSELQLRLTQIENKIDELSSNSQQGALTFNSKENSSFTGII